MVHQNGTFLVIQFAVHAGIADQIDDPFLAFVVVQAQSGGEIPIVREKER